MLGLRSPSLQRRTGIADTILSEKLKVGFSYRTSFELSGPGKRVSGRSEAFSPSGEVILRLTVRKFGNGPLLETSATCPPELKTEIEREVKRNGLYTKLETRRVETLETITAGQKWKVVAVPSNDGVAESG